MFHRNYKNRVTIYKENNEIHKKFLTLKLKTFFIVFAECKNVLFK